MLAKLIPLALVGGLAVGGMTQGKKQLAYFQNIAQISATQQEEANIQKLIMIELTESQLPGDAWMNIVRQQVSAKGRDPVVDRWGYYYSCTFGEGTVVVGSAGPDVTFQTEDDIITR